MDEITTGFDAEIEEQKGETAATENKPRPFLIWSVGEKEYKLKLTNSVITKLEQQFDKPIMDAILDDGIPRLSTTIAIIQGAMLKFEHGIKASDVSNIMDVYIDSGKTMMDLLKEVIYPLMYDAGFFTKAMLESVTKDLEDVDTGL